MNRPTVALAVPIGAALLFATFRVADLSSRMPRRAEDLLCGRVVAVSCEGSSSPVTLSIRSDAGDRVWQIDLPFEHRREIGAGIESRYERHVVCVPSGAAPLIARGRVLLDPTQLTVKNLVEAPVSLPSNVFRGCDPDVQSASPIRTVKPRYTSSAMHAKVQGSVVLFGIVDQNGVVGQVRVVASLEPSLDAEAKKAFERWRFRPAVRNGEPVALAVSVEMSFVAR